jgi:D-alanyl-D-alanine endopeptidase (penicillin-binding protein 7)
MPSSKKKDLGLAVLVAAMVAAAGLVPLAYRYGTTHRPPHADTRVAGGPAAPAPAPGTRTDVTGATPAPPGTEEVPAEEAESDRGPASASPAGPTLSFARAAGLHLVPDPAHLNSSAAIVIDQGTGQVLAQKNEQAVLPMASLTKLMTTLLVLEAKQPMDEVLTITEDDVDNERHSRSRLRVGTTLTREEALHLALMSSENRAAHALARAYPGGVPRLVGAMNARARALGMTNTTYVDPTGLSNRNQSTAHDLAVLVAEVAKNPVIRDFSTTPAHVASLGGRTLQYKNSNRLVRSDKGRWDIELQKTGYIVEAGRCLTMLTKVAGHDLVMVLLDADTNGARLADAEKLRRWVVAQNGWQEEPPVARAHPDGERKVAAASEGAGGGEEAKAPAHRKVKARAKAKHGARHEVAVAAKGKARSEQVAAASKDDGKAGKDDGKSASKSAGKKARKPGQAVAKKGDGDEKPRKHAVAAAKKAAAESDRKKKARVRRSYAAAGSKG